MSLALYLSRVRSNEVLGGSSETAEHVLTLTPGANSVMAGLLESAMCNVFSHTLCFDEKEMPRISASGSALASQKSTSSGVRLGSPKWLRLNCNVVLNVAAGSKLRSVKQRGMLRR